MRAVHGLGGRLEPTPELTPRRRSRWGLAATLSPPLAWLVVIYIGSLLLLIVSAAFTIDPRSNRPTTDLTTDNLQTAFTVGTYIRLVAKTVGAALAVTALCFVIALPVAFYIAKVAKPWARRGLVVALLLPLWAGYLVKGYAWKAMLRPASRFGVDTHGGFLDSVFGWTPGFGWVAVILTLTYLWLPYMVLPIYAGLDRLPASLLEASGDLGARPWRTFRSVIMPMLVPSIAAGSIFTFSLSLGDYIIPRIVTEGRVRMLGNTIEQYLLAPNQPLAAAFTIWPLLLVFLYLLAMKRLRAFESL